VPNSSGPLRCRPDGRGLLSDPNRSGHRYSSSHNDRSPGCCLLGGHRSLSGLRYYHVNIGAHEVTSQLHQFDEVASGVSVLLLKQLGREAEARRRSHGWDREPRPWSPLLLLGAMAWRSIEPEQACLRWRRPGRVRPQGREPTTARFADTSSVSHHLDGEIPSRGARSSNQSLPTSNRVSSLAFWKLKFAHQRLARKMPLTSPKNEKFGFHRLAEIPLSIGNVVTIFWAWT
jgi:hypothetical protein